MNAEPLHPERLTWAALLGQWIDFAKQAVGLPDDAAGRLMRASVADVIMLQAVWFALQQLDELEPSERALGMDRAELLIEKHAAAIRERYENVPMPSLLNELIEDAENALAKAKEDY